MRHQEISESLHERCQLANSPHHKEMPKKLDQDIINRLLGLINKTEDHHLEGNSIVHIEEIGNTAIMITGISNQ